MARKTKKLLGYDPDQIADMEEEFRKLASIEISVTKKSSVMRKVLNSFFSDKSLYRNPAKLQELVDDANSIIETLAGEGRKRGAVMANKTMKRFIDEFADRAPTPTVSRLVEQLSDKQAAERLSLYRLEVQKEVGILKSDIDIFVKRSQMLGRTEKEILRDIMYMNENDAGFVEAFKKRMDTIDKSIVRREAQAEEMATYQSVAASGEDWQWITVSVTPCPDCKIRAGVVLSLQEWERRGFPGAGQTVCGGYCMCKLIPISVSEDLFPDVKTFKWNKDSGVLTSAQDKRVFGAEQNQPPQEQ